MPFKPLPPEKDAIPNYMEAICAAYGQLKFADGAAHVLNIVTTQTQNPAGTVTDYTASDGLLPNDPDAGAGKNTYPISPVINPNPAQVALTIGTDLYTEEWIYDWMQRGIDEGTIRGWLTTAGGSGLAVAAGLGFSAPKPA
jgi:hypothetical protein